MMLTPAQMSFVHVLVSERQFLGLFAELVKTNSFQIVSKDKISEYGDSLRKYEVREMIDKFSDLEARVENILGLLNIKVRSIEEDVDINPPKVLEKAEEKIAKIESDVSATLDRIRALDEKVSELDELSERVTLLEREGIQLDRLENIKFLHLVCGFTTRANLLRLRAGLASFPHVLIHHLYPFKDIVYVYVLVPLVLKTTLENALRAAPFTADEFLDKLSGDLQEVSERVEVELWEAREERASLLAEVQQLKEKYTSTLLRLKRLISVNSLVVRAFENVGRTDKLFMISGWLPHKSLRKVRKIIKKYDQSLFEASPPLPPSEVQNPKLVPPTKFEHPAFIRPFEGLVTTFGYPRYSDLDPTLFVMLSFLLMFGIMFADIGHGGIIFLVGLLLTRFKDFKNFGAIMSWCGAVSVLFGFLFGSVFGKEDILPALWFRPFENIMNFLKIAVYFGIGMISLGLVLNVVQNVRRKSWDRAIFGKYGIAGAVLYWAVIFTAIYLLKGGALTAGAKVIIGSVFLSPIIAISLGNFIWTRLKKKIPEEGLLESAFGVVELGLSILSNTLSFLRVAAFNISHAGLCIAIYTVAEQMKQLMPTKGASLSTTLSVVIPGNLLILGLEGLIVFIQCLRLEYYEFFSKFFGGQGVKFQPLSISNTLG